VLYEHTDWWFLSKHAVRCMPMRSEPQKLNIAAVGYCFGLLLLLDHHRRHYDLLRILLSCFMPSFPPFGFSIG
jgi:hypothetical protein